jgi:hypothetical protein
LFIGLCLEGMGQLPRIYPVESGNIRTSIPQ